MSKSILILLLVIINACSAQKKEIMKTFDIKTFNNNKNHLNRYSFIIKDDTTVEQHRWQFGYEEIITKKNSLTSTFYKYYENGELKLKGDFFPDDFQKGVWKEYDEQGNLINEINHDASYKFTWEDILKFIKEKKLDMNHNQFSVSRSFGYGTENLGKETAHPFWSITHPFKNKYKLNIIIIDGVTGDVIDSYEDDYPSGGEYEDENDYPIEDE